MPRSRCVYLLRARLRGLRPIRSRRRLTTSGCNCSCSAALVAYAAARVPGVGRRPWLSPIAARSAVSAACCSRALTLSLAGAAQPAAAQGLFEALFGGFRRPRARAAAAGKQFIRRSACACSAAEPARRRSQRLRPRHASTACGPATAAISRCSAMPARRRPSCASRSARRPRRMVFSGSKIDTRSRRTARAMPISTTPSSIATRSVDGCTCNGKDALRPRARRDVQRSDAAAGRHRCDRRRPGDLHRQRAKDRRSSRRSSSSSSEWARRLAEVKVRPAPPSDKIEPVANDDTSRSPQEPRSSCRYGRRVSFIEIADHLVGERKRRGQPGDSIPNRCTRPRQAVLRRRLRS